MRFLNVSWNLDNENFMQDKYNQNKKNKIWQK